MSGVAAQRRSTARAVEATTDAPLYRRVERDVPKLAPRMVETFVEEIPLYALLPREQLDGEILGITEANLRTFFPTLRGGRLMTPEGIAGSLTFGRRRAGGRV